MEVNNGYKFTELGEIPSDWEFKTLDSITIEHKQGYYTKEAYILYTSSFKNATFPLDKKQIL